MARFDRFHRILFCVIITYIINILDYFTSISYMDLGRLQKRSEEAKAMRKKIALLKSENSKLIKEKTEQAADQNSKHSTPEFVDNFFQNFKPYQQTNLENESLSLLFLQNQLSNLTQHPNHRSWDDKIKAISYHEYFHNSVLGKGVYKIFPCEKTVNTFFKNKN